MAGMRMTLSKAVNANQCYARQGSDGGMHAVPADLVQDARALIIDGHPVPGRTIRLGVHILQPLSQHPHILKVNIKELLQARPLHLHHHLLSIQAGQVHLPQGRNKLMHGTINTEHCFSFDQVKKWRAGKSWKIRKRGPTENIALSKGLATLRSRELQNGMRNTAQHSMA